MMLRDDCALNLWCIQIAPKPQACPRKSLGHARGHCGAHFERLVDANKIIIQEMQLCLLKTSSAAEILVRYRVPTANPKRLTATANRLILAPDERSLQVYLVRLDRTVPVAGYVGSRDPCCRSRKFDPVGFAL
jgi:hypothetical protein